MIISEPSGQLSLENLDKLLCDELADLLHAENMLLKALPKLAAGSSSPELKALFESHLLETRLQVKRIEKMFATLDRPAREKKCEAMMGLLVECQHVLTRTKPSPVVDQALICAARKVESFEIVSYESIAVWAGFCGYTFVKTSALKAAREEEVMLQALLRLVVPAEATAPAIPPALPKTRLAAERKLATFARD